MNAFLPGPGAKRPLRIFVVENHEDTRFLLCLLLEQLGHTVFSAPTLAGGARDDPGGAAATSSSPTSACPTATAGT